MSENLQKFAKFQEFQLDNLVDLKNAAKRVFSCKNRCRYSRKRATFCQKLATTLRVHYPTGAPGSRPPRAPWRRRRRRTGCQTRSPEARSRDSNDSKSGLASPGRYTATTSGPGLGCIEVDFCKEMLIYDLQHFSRATRYPHLQPLQS